VTSSEQDPRTEVLALVCGIKDSRPTDLGGRRDFASVLGFDSLDLIELSVRLEKTYGIKVGDQPGDMAALDDIEALAVLVRHRRNR
jgi:acyl carrier protein